MAQPNVANIAIGAGVIFLGYWLYKKHMTAKNSLAAQEQNAPASTWTADASNQVFDGFGWTSDFNTTDPKLAAIGMAHLTAPSSWLIN